MTVRYFTMATDELDGITDHDLVGCAHGDGTAFALTADADFESKHPRDSAGRFGEGDGTPAPARTPADAVAGIRPEDPSKLAFSREWMSKEIGNTSERKAKGEVARNLARNMTSSTGDMLACAFDGGMMIPDAWANRDDYLIVRTIDGITVSKLAPDEIGDHDISPAVRANTEEGEALFREAAASVMVGDWAGTSNDSSARSLAMQEAAVREFGLEGTAPWKIENEGLQARVEDRIAQHEPVMRDFLRAQYEATQARLAADGIKDLAVTRGFTWAHQENPPVWARNPSDTTDLQTRPLSAWSISRDTARNFAGVGTVVTARVPAEAILSYPMTGFGCMNEGEVVVLGGLTTVHHESFGW